MSNGLRIRFVQRWKTCYSEFQRCKRALRLHEPRFINHASCTTMLSSTEHRRQTADHRGARMQRPRFLGNRSTKEETNEDQEEPRRGHGGRACGRHGAGRLRFQQRRQRRRPEDRRRQGEDHHVARLLRSRRQDAGIHRRRLQQVPPATARTSSPPVPTMARAGPSTAPSSASPISTPTRTTAPATTSTTSSSRSPSTSTARKRSAPFRWATRRPPCGTTPTCGRPPA